MINVLSGKLEYLKMVKGECDSTYQNLKNRFDKLNTFKKVNKVLSIWEEKGIEEAMKDFNKTEQNNEMRKLSFIFDEEQIANYLDEK